MRATRLIGVLAAAALAMPAAGSAAPPHRVPAGHSQADRLEALLEGPFAPADASARLASLRRQEGGHGTPIIGELDRSLGRGNPQRPSPAGAHEAASAEAEGGWLSYAAPIGDIDGDARTDVVVLDVATSSEQRLLSALSSADGGVVWADDATASTIVPAGGDLTGDGAEDLLEFRTERFEVLVEEGCDEGYGCTDYVAEWTSALVVRSGATGETAWSWAWDGGTEQHTTGSGWTAETEGALLRADVVSAGREVVLVLSDYAASSESSTESTIPLVGPVLLGERTTVTRVEETVAVHRLAGADGRSLAEFQRSTDGWFWPTVWDDALLLEIDVRPEQTEVCQVGLLSPGLCTVEGDPFSYRVAVQELDGSTRWETTGPEPYGFAYPLDGDPDGDGLDEYVQVNVGDDSTYLSLLSGADGGVLYERGVRPFEFVRGLGDVDGDGHEDLLSASDDIFVDEVTLERFRLDGSTILSTTHVAEHGDDNTFDNFPELNIERSMGQCALLFSWHAYEAPEGWVYPHSATFERYGCASAEAQWAVGLEGDHHGYDLGDLTGDGRFDVLTAPGYLAGPASEYRPTLIDGADGAVAWTKAYDVPWGTAVSLGNGGAALLYDIDNAGPVFSVLEIHGADGVMRWSRRSP